MGFNLSGPRTGKYIYVRLVFKTFLNSLLKNGTKKIIEVINLIFNYKLTALVFINFSIYNNYIFLKILIRSSSC
jgi:hypothetical protein